MTIWRKSASSPAFIPGKNPKTHLATEVHQRRLRHFDASPIMTGHRTRRYSVDVARGFCLVIMTIDHMPTNPLSRFSNAVFGTFGFFTGASGFVFLSGLVSAWAYGSLYEKQGPTATWRHALRRATQLYVVNTSV